MLSAVDAARLSAVASAPSAAPPPPPWQRCVRSPLRAGRRASAGSVLGRALRRSELLLARDGGRLPSFPATPLCAVADGTAIGDTALVTQHFCAAGRVRRLCVSCPHAAPDVSALARAPRERRFYETVAAQRRRSCDDAQAGPSVLVLPGNPGVPAYYQCFVEALWSRCGGRSHVSCVGFLGHTAAAPPPQHRAAWFTLEEQVQHALRELEARVAADGGRPAVLVGHSIGGHMALRLLVMRPQLVEAVVGVQPYLTNNLQSAAIARVKRLVTVAPLVWACCAAGALLASLPIWLRAMLLRPALAAIGLERAAADTTITALRWGTVANFIRMGRTELEALQALPDWPALAPHAAAHRIAFFYGTPDDVWAPPQHECAAEQALPGLLITRDASQPHTFCVTRDGSEAVAASVAAALDVLRERRRQACNDLGAVTC